MKILKKAVTPDGINIQLEDWSEDFTHCAYGATIAAYPKKYMRRRAEVELSDHHNALSVFEALLNGNSSILEVDFLTMETGGYRVPFKPILERQMKRHSA